MKRKLFFALFSLCLGLCGRAQFEKGTRMIGATIGSGYFSSGNTDFTLANYSTKSNNWNISLTPSFGRFISERTAVGASLFLNTTHQHSWNEANGGTYKRDRSHNTDYGIGLFYRRYFSSSSSLHPFAHAYVNGGSGTGKTDGFYYVGTLSQTYTGKSSDRFFYNAGLNAGITKMVSATVGLDAFIGYSHSYSKVTNRATSFSSDSGTGNVSSSEFNTPQKYSGNNLNVGVGLQVFLLAKGRK